jgi:hypothetical protein
MTALLAGEARRRYVCGMRPRAVTIWGLLTPLAVVAAGAGAGCKPRDEAIAAPFTDSFDRAELGPLWTDTGAAYRITDGRLNGSHAYNHPAWLRKRLPVDALIELDVMSKSPAGDIKIELYGDGQSFDPDKGAYTSTGYVLIFGGWNNSLNVICRINEHDDGRKAERREPRVTPGRVYHWTITRRAGAIDWKIDGQPFLAWTDPAPLGGAGHEYLAVNDWESDVYFDNLSVRPLP